jgi:hypothetical protein
MERSPLVGLFRRVHEDEGGTVSLETVLILFGVAIPVILALWRLGWPRVQTCFAAGIDALTAGFTADGGPGGGAGT